MSIAKRKNKIKYIIGVDEAGRGPLAGPVAVAAIAIPRGAKLPAGVRDSKTLSAAQRERLRHELKKLFPSCVAMVGAATIDRIGISRAVRLATFRAVNRLHKLTWESDSQVGECEVLLDGLLKAPAQFRQKTITGGDKTIPAISAASIIAKTTRDRKMLRLHRDYPQYGFDRHMGYGTAAHYRALKKHGLSPEHRKGYCATFLA